jgi:hypothetical protein
MLFEGNDACRGKEELTVQPDAVNADEVCFTECKL